MSYTGTLTREPALPDNPWNTVTGSAQTWTVTVVEIKPRMEWRGDTLIQTSDRRVMMDALGPRPRPEDKLTLGSDTYRVTAVDSTEPAGVPLLYILEISE